MTSELPFLLPFASLSLEAPTEPADTSDGLGRLSLTQSYTPPYQFRLSCFLRHSWSTDSQASTLHSTLTTPASPYQLPLSDQFANSFGVRGLGSAEIARRLQISSSTVRILRRHFAGGPFILQQDWAPSHGSRSTLAVLEAHFPGFLDKNLWPASSPDLNPMDFSVWGMLEGKIAGKVFATVDDLKAALEVAWASIDDGYLRRTVNSVKKRLRACVKARGSNFEILL
uniref:Tc1-like transposase DDE domain-containing protein n=1 Tax=Caenorhabditis japonica TaxID=281687 RepID=A0A8R1ESZ9_CAEJA